MVRTQVAWWFRSSDNSVEHAAKRDAIDITGMNTETDETAGELIHYHQHPMTFEVNRLTSEQIGQRLKDLVPVDESASQPVVAA